MSDARRREIRQMIVDHLVFHLEEALEGSEEIFKEVWESVDDDETKIVDAEIAEIIKLLQTTTKKASSS